MVNKGEKVAVVTVTYGNRLKYVQEVIEKVSQYQQVTDIVVVNNGSTDSKNIGNKEGYKSIHLINNSRNMGSAVGYATGLAYSFKLNVDYIWLLDDDNCPRGACLDTLLSLYNKSRNSRNLYAAFRDDRTGLKNKGKQNYEKNSFFEFNLINRLNSNNTKSQVISNLIQCDSVPYGGLLLPKDVAIKNGLPNTEYYLYNDDNDYTYRLTRSGYTIFCSTNSVIHDLEQSWYRRESVPMFLGFFRTKMLRNGVYTIRNRTYFEINNIVTNKFIYIMNIFVYLLYVLIFYMPKNKNGLKRYLLICRMVYDGLNGNLGIIEESNYSVK